MRVVIQKLDQPSRSGKIYSTKVMQDALTKCANKIVVGTYGYPRSPVDSTAISIDEISHTVNNLRIEDGALVGDVHVLDTPRGAVLRQIMSESELEFRLMGVGTTEALEDGHLNVSRFDLIAICATLPDVTP